MYGPYTEILHTNHLRRVNLSSHFIDWSLCFSAFYYREKILPVDINGVKIKLGISFGMDTGMDQGDEFEENKTKMRIFDKWNYNLHNQKEMANTSLINF